MSRKPSVHPDSIQLDLERVATDLVKVVGPEYRSAWDYTHGKRDHKGNHVDKDNSGQERVSTSGTSDPTGSTVASQEWASNELRAVAKKVDRLVKDVSSLKGRLSGIFTDPDEEYEPLRRQPILSTAQTLQKKEGQRMQHKRHLEEEEKRLQQQLIRVRREMREAG